MTCANTAQNNVMCFCIKRDDTIQASLSRSVHNRVVIPQGKSSNGWIESLPFLISEKDWYRFMFSLNHFRRFSQTCYDCIAQKLHAIDLFCLDTIEEMDWPDSAHRLLQLDDPFTIWFVFLLILDMLRTLRTPCTMRCWVNRACLARLHGERIRIWCV